MDDLMETTSERPVVNGVKGANLVLMFLLELVVLASPVIWAFGAFESVAPKVFASFLLLGAIATGWIVIGAQRSSKPLTLVSRSVRELVWFGAGVLLLWLSGRHGIAIGFAALVVINLVLRLAWQQVPTANRVTD